MHLNIVSVLEKSVWSRIYWLAKNIHSTCFAPKTGLNRLRKMLVISHLAGITKLWVHQLLGWGFTQLTIDSSLIKSIWPRRWPAKTTNQPIFLHARKCSPLEKLVKYWKNGPSGLGKMPSISYLTKIKFLWRNHHASGLLIRFPIDSTFINSL